VTRKLLLLNPGMGDYYATSKVKSAITLSPPLNLALVGAAARQAGHQVAAIDYEATPDADLSSTLRSFEPDVVGITFRTPLFPAARKLAEQVRRERPDTLLIAGGVHASTRPHETVRRAPFDVAVKGEGDQTLVELLAGRPYPEIRGIVWPDGETPARTLIPDLDPLPMPAWDLFDLAHYRTPSLVAHTVPVADLESSRGCQARCIYCTKGVFGNAFRVKSPNRMVDEIEHALGQGFRAFNYVDDSFTTLTSRSIAICEEMVRRGLDVPWSLTNGIRVANVNEEFFRAARAAGCWLLAFGFESGSDRVLKRIKKGATLAQARRAVGWARKYGFTVLGYFMVGLPGETAETIDETARFAASLDVDFAKFSITMPLPGTPLYDSWAENLNDEDRFDFSIHRPGPDLYDHPSFAWPELEAHTRRAYQTFYGRPSYVARRVRRALRRGHLARELRYTAGIGTGSLMEAFARR